MAFGRQRGLADVRALMLAWLCTFAIAFQCILVPAHIHTKTADAQIASIDTGAQTADPTTKRAPADETQTHCFICQQMALAGAAILPDAPAPLLIQRDLSAATTAVEIVTVSLSRSHIWRSRAPPSSLKV